MSLLKLFAIGNLLFLWAADTATAAELPAAVIPAGVGVNIHFTKGHERDLDLIAEAGFKFVRMDFTWAGIERKKGEYDWSAYDELTANLEKRGLRALYILDYSNPLYEETIVSRHKKTGKEYRATVAPRSQESVAAFARWAGAAAARFRGRKIIWEVWNEPNIGFWKPEPNVGHYTALLLATAKAVRAADPQATLVAPASSSFPWDFLEQLFQAGVLEHLDAVSVHPYRSPKQPPETAAADYDKLRQLIARYAPPAKKNLPILSGEWGYSTHEKGVSLETQADFLVRQQLINLLHGVPLSIWYDWKNDGDDPRENEHNFGTVYPDLRPKPSYLAVQTMTRQLTGFRLVRRLSLEDEADYALVLADASGNEKLAVWTSGTPHKIQLAIPGGSEKHIPVIDGRGNPATAQVADGHVQLELTAQPQYLKLLQPMQAQ